MQQPLPAPGHGEVLVRINAIGLNYGDSAFRRGAYLTQPKFPASLGVEACGTVVCIGPDVLGFKEGDRVIALPNFPVGQYGTCASEAILPARCLFPAPPELSDVQCASNFIAFLTAYGALIETASVQRSDRVLITAVSSTVGIAAVQVAMDAGAQPIGVTRSQQKMAEIANLGALPVAVSNEYATWRDDISAAIGNDPVKVIFDSVAGDCVANLMPLLADYGMHIVYGGMAERDSIFPRKEMIRRNLSLRGYQFMDALNRVDYMNEAMQYISPRISSGAFGIPISRSFPLTEITKAYEYMENGSRWGKVVVVP